MIYFLKINSAFLNVYFIIKLSELSTDLLGIYSLISATIAIVYATISFDGHHFVLSSKLNFHKLKCIYAVTLIPLIYLAFIAIFMFAPTMLVVALMWFLLSLTSDTFVHMLSLRNRLNGDEKLFTTMQICKIVVVDIILLGLVVLSMTYTYFTDFVYSVIILFAIALTVLFTCFLYSGGASISSFRLPSKEWIGAAVKRFESMHLRYLVAFFYGLDVLGQWQVIMSVGRSLTLLTPLFINKNYNNIISNKSYLKNFVLVYSTSLLMGLLIFWLIYFEIIFATSVSWVSSIMLLHIFHTANLKAFVRVYMINKGLFDLFVFILILTITSKWVFAFALGNDGDVFLIMNSIFDVFAIGLMMYRVAHR